MIHIVVPGPPPRKNARGTIARSRKTGKPIRITPKKTKAWRERLYASMPRGTTLVMGAGQRGGIKTGAWSIALHIYENEHRHLDVLVPSGDVDSSITAILDALQPKAVNRGRCAHYTPGLIDDDARIVKATIEKHYDKANPRVEITLTEIEPGGPTT